ncbi:C6 transcription factor [Ophiocordyceps camponoti-floridani]|uniref:C6 transcription factor n=1 Tax=Ophiocordyceps camponoti-floridani TaxID=2030778 RepID=A0A8H4VDG0_9HYPO|nr:C6 transcription factor [Ophiocordyceps camponoti-floridani]
MVGQLLIGAAVTSLGSFAKRSGVPITILGALNTVMAGLLALLHNSGLPDRYRYDMAQFEELEDRIKEILESGIAPIDQTTDQVLAECFDLFRMAKATVNANMPATYNSRQTLQTGTGGTEPTAPRPSADPTVPRMSAAAPSMPQWNATAPGKKGAADSPGVSGGDKRK